MAEIAVTIDAEIIHDALGFPYFPAKKFKGLLYDNDAGQVSSVQLIVHDFYLKGYEKLRAGLKLDGDTLTAYVGRSRFTQYGKCRFTFAAPKEIPAQDVAEKFCAAGL